MSARSGSISVDWPGDDTQWCPACRTNYPLNDPRWRCDCGGDQPLRLSPGKGLGIEDIDTASRSMWRYRAALRIPPGAEVTLGEGGTPLVPLSRDGRKLYAKLDFLMPTGSFKDRGAALVISHLRRCAISGVVEDSSGNAGASYAAYAAAAGLRCTVFAPSSVTPAKLQLVELYGGNLRTLDASRDHVSIAAQKAEGADIYGGHNWQPFFVEGTKTLAYELWEQLGWRQADAIVVPVGGGSNLLGLDAGFRELMARGAIKRLPRLYGIQSDRCPPLAKAFAVGADAAVDIVGGPTIAEGLALQRPPRAREVLQSVRLSGGSLISVAEGEIVGALKGLASKGLLVDPTAAVSYAGFERLAESKAISHSEVVVIVLTGTGLKAVDRIHELLHRGVGGTA